MGRSNELTITAREDIIEMLIWIVIPMGVGLAYTVFPYAIE